MMAIGGGPAGGWYWLLEGERDRRAEHLKARRWTGVGVVSFSIRWPLKLMVWRLRVERWSRRSPYLRTGSFSLLCFAPSLARACAERSAGDTGSSLAGMCWSV